jgi:hypothetical protein
MTTKTEAIRAINDELRQNLTAGTALIATGVAALGAEAVARIVKLSPCTMTSTTPATRTWNMTLVRSRSMAHAIFFNNGLLHKTRSCHS